MAAFLHLFDAFRPRKEEGAIRPDARRPKLGIAFSSGGAKGLAHIGVIQVLEEHGIEVDAIAGTSMGAYVGGLWASGLNGSELEKLAATMARSRHRWRLIDPVLPPRRGFVGGKKILLRLQESLHETDFSELEKPFVAIATELNTLERAVLCEGDVASAILASLAVPGIMTPVVREGVEYIDGGVSDPLPVRILRESMGVETVIAVNVLPPVGTLREHRQSGCGANRWKAFLCFLNRHLNLFAPGNLLDILRGAAIGAQMRLVTRSAAQADVLITPMSVETGWHDYHRYRHYIELGRRAAEAALPAILALLDEKAPDPGRPDETETELTECA